MTSVSTFRNRRVLVTGGTGLLGGWLVKALIAQAADVVLLIRDWTPNSLVLSTGDANRVTVVRGDVTDYELLLRVLGEYEISTVFHLAAQTLVPIANRHPLSTFETNIAGTWRLLDACRVSPLVQAVVFASSDKAYGESETLPYVETMPLSGKHPYDVSKSCGDLIAQSYAETFDLPVCVIRCGNLFGGGDLNWNRLVPGTIRSVLQGERPVIRSDGSMIRDYIYVENAASAYLRVAEKLLAEPSMAGEAFNIAAEGVMSVLEVVEAIIDVAGVSLEPDIRNTATAEIQHQYLATDKAKTVLGWSNTIEFREGLSRTVTWYERFLSQP